MIVQISAIMFLVLWVFWSWLSFRKHHDFLVSIICGMVASFVTFFVLLIAVFSLATATGYLS